MNKMFVYKIVSKQDEICLYTTTSDVLGGNVFVCTVNTLYRANRSRHTKRLKNSGFKKSQTVRLTAKV